MANLSEDIQCAGSDTRPPMLDKADFASWQQRIRLYCRGKDNGINILKSIDEGPFQMGTTREIIDEGTEGPINLGPERPRVYSELSQEEKDRYNADIRATNDHTQAVKLNKGLKDSNFDQLYAYLKQHEAHANENKMMLERLTQQTVDPLALMSNVSHQQVIVQNVQGRQNRGQGNSARGAGAVGYGRAQNRVGNANPGQARQMKIVGEQPVQDLALNVDNVFQADDCDAYDSDVDDAPTAQTLFMANLSSADPVYDEAGPSYDSDVLSEVQAHDHYQDAVCDHHEEHEMHDDEQVELYERRARFELTEREQKIDEQLRIVICDRNIKEENLNKELHSIKLQLASTIQHNKLMVDEVNIVEKGFNQKENKFLEEFLETLKCFKKKGRGIIYSNRPVIPFFKTLQEHFEGIQKALTKEVKEMSDAFDELEAELDQSIVDRKHDAIERKNLLLEHDNIIADCLLKEVFYVASNSELNVVRFTEMQKAHHVVKTRCLELEVELSNLRDDIRKDNYNDLLNRFSNLKESVDTLRDIVEEAKAESPLDRSLEFACRYTKHSQELLEYVFGTCPKVFNQQDKKHATTPRKKQVAFEDQIATSSSTTHKHVEPRFTKTYKNVPAMHYATPIGTQPTLGIQFPNSPSYLEVAFRKHSCYVRDTDGVELLKGSRGSNLYTISVEDMMKSSPICLLSKASKNKSWLWHRRLTIGLRYYQSSLKKDLARGLPRLKFEKDHLCSACQLGKSKKHTHKPKTENTNLEVLNTLHMDLCGPMRDETPAVVIKFLTQIQVGLNKTVRFIRTDNGTEFVNRTLYDHYEKVGIFHQKTVPRTPQQNGVVERRNRTLVEAARTMLIFSKAPMFLWAEAVATACYTQNRSLIHTRHEKTPYELVHDKKPDLTFFRVFGALCYPTNDSENLGKLQPTADIGIFVGYAPNRKGYRIYNKRTQNNKETIHLVPNPAPAIPFAPPTNKELEMLFQPMFDEYFNPPGIRQNPIPVIPTAGEPSAEVNPFAAADPEPFVNVFAPDPTSEASSSREIMMPELNQSTQPHEHIRKWTDSHPLDNIIGNPSRPVSTRKQLLQMLCATEDCWFQAMQDEIHEFDRLDVWELVPPPDSAMIIALKWIYKVKLDEYGDVLKNKARLVAKGFRQEEGLDFEESIANAASKNMTVYQMDVKNCILKWRAQRRSLCESLMRLDVEW
ncbi:retrovirus-related pol polyprotein from transposon TNT 1-94 [Tanacetum coccineum]